MKLCEKHWLRLKEELDKRGLTPFVASGGEHMVAKLKSALGPGGTPTKANFEPLMSANLALVAHVLDELGPIMTLPDDNGKPKCPICFAQEMHDKQGECEIKPPCDFANWICCAADDQLKKAKSLGLVGAS